MSHLQEERTSQDRLFPHEFLFLICNAKNRHDMIKALPKAESSIERKSIKKYQMPYLDSLRLDKLYKMEEGFFSRDLSKNPKDIVIRIMNNDINRKILRFEGIKNF